MQIITTEFKGPTNSTGSRIRVRSWLKSASIPYNHALNSSENHRGAAQQLVNRLNADRLKDTLHSNLWEITAEGSLPNGKGYGFVIELNVEVSASWSVNPETGRMEATR